VIYTPYVHAQKLVAFYGSAEAAIKAVRAYRHEPGDKPHFRAVLSELKAMAAVAARIPAEVAA
jgi:hypothetical protein